MLVHFIRLVTFELAVGPTVRAFDDGGYDLSLRWDERLLDRQSIDLLKEVA
jgi:hypothetical protein